MRYKFKLAFILGRDPISFALTNSMAQVGKPSHAKNRTTVLFYYRSSHLLRVDDRHVDSRRQRRRVGRAVHHTLRKRNLYIVGTQRFKDGQIDQ